MYWKNLVSQAFRESDSALEGISPRFEPGASEDHLRDAEHRLGALVPDDLRSLLMECDGVMEVMEIQGRPIDTQWLIWPVETIVSANVDPRRSDIGLPESWFIFATADGHDFGYDRTTGNSDIWVWHPMDNVSEHVAQSLDEFLRRRIKGALRL